MRTVLFAALLLLGGIQTAVRPIVVHDTLRTGLRAPYEATEVPAAPEKPSALQQSAPTTPVLVPPSDDKHLKAFLTPGPGVVPRAASARAGAADAGRADVLPPFVRPLVPRAPPPPPRV